jgi:hypothetical protein
MSAIGLRKAVRHLQESALGVLWRQWTALGAAAAGSPARSLVDPEALILASLAMRDEERRLSDALRWWAGTGAQLLSITRIRTLASRFTESTRACLGEFASLVLHEGRDFRWRPLAQPAAKQAGRSGKTVGLEASFTSLPALPLRLRLGFGVTAKADILAVLLGSPDRWLTARELAAALGYTTHSIRRAADDLLAARLIQATRETTTGYRLDPTPWAGWLGISATIPPWRHWAPAFGFVATVVAWSREETRPELSSPYLLSSQVRDIVESHQDAFVRNRIAVPLPEDHPGETYLPAFQDTLASLSTWLDENG